MGFSCKFYYPINLSLPEKVITMLLKAMPFSFGFANAFARVSTVTVPLPSSSAPYYQRIFLPK
jgi:hypothetical protein